MGDSTCVIACCNTLSTAVGIPSVRFFPLSLGISTLRTGFGRYFPSRTSFTSSSPLSLRYCRRCSTIIPLTLCEPLFLFTCLYASLRFPRLKILSKSPSHRLLAFVLLFSVIRLSVSTPAYPSCSALSLCGQSLL